MATIDYSPLGNAVQRLKKGLEALGHEPENTLYRDAVIQRFEFTYGLCASMLERYLTHASAVEPEKEMAFPTLIRTASDLGVLRSGGMFGLDTGSRRISPVMFIARRLHGRCWKRYPALRKKRSFFTYRLKGRQPVATDLKALPIPKIVIEPHEWEELSAILVRYVPGRRVWAFGSRATGRRVRRFSDLDLLIDVESLFLTELADLDDALVESRLPFKVHVVPTVNLTPEFRARIEPEMVLVQDSESAQPQVFVTS